MVFSSINLCTVHYNDSSICVDHRPSLVWPQSPPLHVPSSHSVIHAVYHLLGLPSFLLPTHYSFAQCSIFGSFSLFYSPLQFVIRKFQPCTDPVTFYSIFYHLQSFHYLHWSSFSITFIQVFLLLSLFLTLSHSIVSAVVYVLSLIFHHLILIYVLSFPLLSLHLFIIHHVVCLFFFSRSLLSIISFSRSLSVYLVTIFFAFFVFFLYHIYFTYYCLHNLIACHLLLFLPPFKSHPTLASSD